MWITKRKLKEYCENLKKMNFSLMQDYNAAMKENYELTQKVNELEIQLDAMLSTTNVKTKTRKSSTKKKDVVKKTNTRKPRT